LNAIEANIPPKITQINSQCDFGFGVYYQFPHGDRWGWVCDSYRANFRKFDVFERRLNAIEANIPPKITQINSCACWIISGGVCISNNKGLTAGLSIITAQRFGAQDFRGVKKSFAVAIIITVKP
jgi:hypothetical protein